MFVPFDQLPDTARIWIYQANSEMENATLSRIEEELHGFVNNWLRHGSPLKASYQIAYGQFIIIGVDENYASVSGCSIDASVHKIQEIEKLCAVQLLDKMSIAYRDNATIQRTDMRSIKRLIADNQINEDTIVFNNMVTTKADLSDKWELAIKDSWHKRFLA